MILVESLSKRYRSNAAVDDLTFSVEPGLVTGFLGPNGAGKSTTLRIVMGLAASDQGRALVLGKPYNKHRRPLTVVGALLDGGGAHRGRSARQHLLWMAQSNGLSRGRVTDVLETVGLTSVARKRVGTFSLGMKQRLGIAAAMLGDPQILILDEPMNGLDPEGIAWLRDFLREQAQAGKTVLISSHLMSEVSQIADRLLVIGTGRLRAEGPLEDVVAGYASLEAAYFALTSADAQHKTRRPDSRP